MFFLSITIIILCGEYYTYDAVGGEEYAICYRGSEILSFFALSDNASSYSSKFNLQKYVKFVVSLLLVVLILTPLLNYCRQM